GHFEHEHVGWKVSDGERRTHPLGELDRPQTERRDVHRHVESQTGGAPTNLSVEGFGQHPICETIHETGLLGKRDESTWRDHAEGSALPAEQRFDSYQRPIVGSDLWLICESQLAPIAGFPQGCKQTEIFSGE